MSNRDSENNGRIVSLSEDEIRRLKDIQKKLEDIIAEWRVRALQLLGVEWDDIFSDCRNIVFALRQEVGILTLDTQFNLLVPEIENGHARNQYEFIKRCLIIAQALCSYIDDLLQAQESKAKSASPTGSIKKVSSIAKYPTPQGTKWEDVTVQIVSKDSLKIKVIGKKPIKYMFSDIGFKHGRKRDLPDDNWEFLFELARNGGKLTDWPPKSTQTVQYRIGKIRERFKAIMGIDRDPIPYYKGLAFADRKSKKQQDIVGYKTKFELEYLSV